MINWRKPLRHAVLTKNNYNDNRFVFPSLFHTFLYFLSRTLQASQTLHFDNRQARVWHINWNELLLFIHKGTRQMYFYPIINNFKYHAYVAHNTCVADSTRNWRRKMLLAFESYKNWRVPKSWFLSFIFLSYMFWGVKIYIRVQVSLFLASLYFKLRKHG